MNPAELFQPPVCFTVRRLTPADAPQALGLFAAQGRDSVWTAAQTPEALWQSSLFFGGFLGRKLALCMGVCKTDAPLPLCEAVRKARVLPEGCTLFLPPAAGIDGAPYLAHFLQIVPAQCLQLHPAPQSTGLAALLPVQTGTPLAGGFFAAGLTLCAIRPLFQLRPHYIFVQTDRPHPYETDTGMQNFAEHSIMIPIADSLSLSRLLEQGHAGTRLVHDSVVMDAS